MPTSLPANQRARHLLRYRRLQHHYSFLAPSNTKTIAYIAISTGFLLVSIGLPSKPATEWHSKAEQSSFPRESHQTSGQQRSPAQASTQPSRTAYPSHAPHNLTQHAAIRQPQHAVCPPFVVSVFTIRHEPLPIRYVYVKAARAGAAWAWAASPLVVTPTAAQTSDGQDLLDRRQQRSF